MGAIGGDASESIPALLKCTRDTSADAWVRYFAIDAVLRVMRDPSEVIPAMIRCLDDDSPEVQGAAIRALGVLGSKAEEALPRLLKILNSREIRREDRFTFVPLRADAAEAIGKIGTRDVAVIRELEALMSDDEPRVQIGAAHGYCRLAEDAGPGLTVLTEHLRRPSRNDVIPYTAAKTLAELGPRARPVVGELVRALEHDKPLVRVAAVKAIADILPGESMELLLPMLEDDDVLVRSSVVEVLGKHEAHDIRLIDVLMRALDDRSGIVRNIALNAIEDMGPKAEKAIPRLEVMAASEDRWERRRIAEVLKRIRGGDADSR